MPQEKSVSRLVTLFDPNDENIKNLEELSTISLHQPSTGEVSDYILVTTRTKTAKSTTTSTESQHQYHVYEVQSLEVKYGSYFLGSHVLRDGTMYIATRMDPLFFVLYYQTSCNTSNNSNNNNNNNKWQPLDQLEIPEIVKRVITNDKHYRHLCQVNNQLGDDMLLYKLSDEKVLQWLTRKQEKAYQVLLDQALLRKKEELTTFVSATCQGFHLLDDDLKSPVASTTTTTLSEPTAGSQQLSSAEQSIVHQHSMQVVCDYITPEWRTKYMNHVGQPESVLMVSSASGEEKQTPKRTWDDAADMNIVSVEKKKTKPEAQSVGLKRLQKVSTKGMKSLSSFFGAKKK
ncbi:RNase H2 complex component [Fragilaria crotonensis]|nr:RNase H2 complex component [Fragilaria crotonensis]